MKKMPFRQVHLDFHTSGAIDGIGSRFDKKQFQEALIAGHVNSITVFSKCHHGWAYHPSKANDMHPGLSFDLLGAQLEACREIGVNAPVYISAGLDEKAAVCHPEWLNVSSPNAGHDFVNAAHYHLLCYNTPYLDTLIAQIEEVMERYNPSGIFLDISNVRTCYCSHCLRSMREKGLDPRNAADVLSHGEMVYANYCKRVEEAVRKYNSETKIFHNAGNIKRGRRDIAGYNTHLELESLPTGGWGYDHFPLSASYVRNLGMEYLGMTGKFHTTWGEFGGFKHPNALKYETALSAAFGAKCSIGDQMHPGGELNMSTYRLIGKAYEDLETIEPWCVDAKAVTDIAVLSLEACQSDVLVRNNNSDTGVCRMLLECKYLFDLVDTENSFDSYKLLILPDHIRLGGKLLEKIKKYLADGGRVLATGESGLYIDRDEFALDFGAEFQGPSEFKPTYMKPASQLELVNGVTEYVMYEQGYNIEAKDNAAVCAYLAIPYFNRAAEHFSSHQHTPNNPDSERDGAVITSNTAYIAWNIFDDYVGKGSLHLKELFRGIVELLLSPDVTLRTALPDRGVTTLMEQTAENRLVHHLLFAYTCLRGDRREVIEDTIPLYNIKVELQLDKAPKRVYLAPQDEDLSHTYSGGVLKYTVPVVDIHQIVVIDK